jgi:hypothetical protein
MKVVKNFDFGVQRSTASKWDPLLDGAARELVRRIDYANDHSLTVNMSTFAKRHGMVAQVRYTDAGCVVRFVTTNSKKK